MWLWIGFDCAVVIVVASGAAFAFATTDYWISFVANTSDTTLSSVSTSNEKTSCHHHHQ